MYFHSPPPTLFFHANFSFVFAVSLSDYFPSPTLFLSLPLNYGSGGAVAYVRVEAASAKRLSNALGRHSPMAGQVQEKPFLFIECYTIRLWDYAQDAQEERA